MRMSIFEITCLCQRASQIILVSKSYIPHLLISSHNPVTAKAQTSCLICNLSLDRHQHRICYLAETGEEALAFPGEIPGGHVC